MVKTYKSVLGGLTSVSENQERQAGYGKLSDRYCDHMGRWK